MIDFLTHQVLASKSLSAETFETCCGSSLQQVLHQEFVAVVHETAHAQNNYKYISAITNLSNTVFECADIGREYNAQGMVIQASKLADFCWVALDCIQAITEGIFDGASNTANMIIHPIETIKGIGTLAYHGACILYDIAGLTRAFITDQKEAEETWDDISNQFSQFLNVLYEKQKELKPRDYCKGMATFATECALQARLIRGITTFYQSTQKEIPTLISRFGRFMPEEELLLSTAEGIQFQITRETQDILQHFVPTDVFLSESVNSRLTSFVLSIQEEIPHLRQLFHCTRKGFAESANKYFKVDYWHILGVELRMVGRKGRIILNGFHHDFMRAMEKAGVFEFANVVKNKFGCYKADIIINGKSIRKTFFPAEWSRKKVIHKIYEAYDHFLQSGAKAILQSGGTYKLVGYTSEGIEIEMIITKTGRLTTAYPII
jgi:hypothetical protein